MNKLVKKLIITGITTAVALGALTACTGGESNLDGGEVSAAEEEPAQTENEEGREALETDAAGDAGADSAADTSALSEETELMGMIEEIPEDSDDSFIVAKLVTEQIDGVDLVSTDADDTKVTVVYSMDTKFVKRTVRDGGEDVKEEDGSEADLKENLTVEMKGSYYKENVFFATDVKIVEVILG